MTERNVATYLRDGNKVFGVDGQDSQLLDGQDERSNGDARHVLRSDLHLGEEAIDEIDGVEQDVFWQIVPDFEAAQDVSGSIARSNRDFTILPEQEEGKPLD